MDRLAILLKCNRNFEKLSEACRIEVSKKYEVAMATKQKIEEINQSILEYSEEKNIINKNLQKSNLGVVVIACSVGLLRWLEFISLSDLFCYTALFLYLIYLYDRSIGIARLEHLIAGLANVRSQMTIEWMHTGLSKDLLSWAMSFIDESEEADIVELTVKNRIAAYVYGFTTSIYLNEEEYSEHLSQSA